MPAEERSLVSVHRDQGDFQAYRFFLGRTVASLLLRGTNLTDAEGRNHVSFLKDTVPLPGRDVRLGLRVDF